MMWMSVLKFGRLKFGKMTYIGDRPTANSLFTQNDKKITIILASIY